MSKYTYKKIDGEEIGTVGHDDNGKWKPESDWESEANAIERSAFLTYGSNKSFQVCRTYVVDNLRKRIEEMHEGYRMIRNNPDNIHISTEYERGAADTCGNILDLPELRLFLPAKEEKINEQ